MILPLLIMTASELFFAWIFQIKVSMRIFDMVLNGTAWWASAHFWIVAQIDQFFFDFLLNVRWMSLVAKRWLTSSSIRLTICSKVVLAEWLEFDDAVKAVRKLRTEEVANSPKTELVRRYELPQSQRWLQLLPVPALDVMIIMMSLEADSPTLTIGQAAIIRTCRNMCITSGWAFSTSSTEWVSRDCDGRAQSRWASLTQPT